MSNVDNSACEIALHNDRFRITLSPVLGKVVVTGGVLLKGDAFTTKAIGLVRQFNDFNDGNDPYGERDFGTVEVYNEIVNWKFDYFDRRYKYLSENPADPEVTRRVLTIYLAHQH